jgi:glycine/serine hydroxymethyltransferase
MREVASLIAEVLQNMTSDASSEDAIAAVRRKVETLTERFPLYTWRRQAVFARA